MEKNFFKRRKEGERKMKKKKFLLKEEENKRKKKKPRVSEVLLEHLISVTCCRVFCTLHRIFPEE